jgi:lipopolysaccharide heptosyltransferase II
MNERAQAVRKILFITLSNIGDVILTLPVFSVLRGNFPQAEISVITGPRAADLFSGSRQVGEIILYDKEISWLAKASLVRDLSRKGFDLVVDLRNTTIPYLLLPPFRTSALGRGAVSKDASKRGEHLAVLEPLQQALGILFESAVPFDFFSEKELASLRRKLAARGVAGNDLIVMAPGANAQIKRWPIAGFARLAERLVRERGARIVLAGAKSDIPVADEILKNSSAPLSDLTGETSIREMAALISMADLVVSNDSSPLQMAYEMKVPCVGVFGPTNEKKYGREDALSAVVRREMACAPCESASCQVERIKACLLDVEPDDVYAACERLLTRAGVS